jgi:OOP family OmpA-OmpF porin
MKKILWIVGILFISGCFFLLFFGCATQEEAVKDEEAEAPREEEVVKEEPVEVAEEEVAEVAEMIDSDNDGIPDDMDKCPDTARGVSVDASGCPEAPTELKDGEFKVVLEFDINSANIRSSYYTMFNEEIKKVMMGNPEARIKSVTINGHSDRVGTERYNYQLSEQRAKSVKRFIVDQFGLDADIISVRAFGEKEPVASNNTAAGRQKNRRVEIIFIVKNLRK